MAQAVKAATLSADEHARGMTAYFQDGKRLSLELGNRGPLRLDAKHRLHAEILEAYSEHGFYVFEDVIGDQELSELRADIDRVLAGAPTEPNGTRNKEGGPVFGTEFERYPYRFAKPLSDPLGGTTLNNGRHPVRVAEPTPSADAPEWTVQLLDGNLQLMDSCLRLYGHPGLLAACASILGDDFVPYNEVAFIKEPG